MVAAVYHPCSLGANANYAVSLIGSLFALVDSVITEQVVVSRIYALPQAQTASEIIAFYGQVICQQLKPAPGSSRSCPRSSNPCGRMRSGRPSTSTARPSSCPQPRAAAHPLRAGVHQADRPRLTDETVPMLDRSARLPSATPPSPFSGTVADVRRTLFDPTSCDNDFEQASRTFSTTRRMSRRSRTSATSRSRSTWTPRSTRVCTNPTSWRVRRGAPIGRARRRAVRTRTWRARMPAPSGGARMPRRRRVSSGGTGRSRGRRFERAGPRSPSELLSVLDTGGAPFVCGPRWPLSAAGGPHPTGAAYTSRWCGSGGLGPPPTVSLKDTVGDRTAVRRQRDAGKHTISPASCDAPIGR